LIGSELASETTAKCVYRILSRVGEGAMGVAFYAMRIAPEGECGVVVKILRPWFVQQWGKTAELIVQKEAVARSVASTSASPRRPSSSVSSTPARSTSAVEASECGPPGSWSSTSTAASRAPR
jgi:hypothetical protein